MSHRQVQACFAQRRAIQPHGDEASLRVAWVTKLEGVELVPRPRRSVEVLGENQQQNPGIHQPSINLGWNRVTQFDLPFVQPNVQPVRLEPLGQFAYHRLVVRAVTQEDIKRELPAFVRPAPLSLALAGCVVLESINVGMCSRGAHAHYVSPARADSGATLVAKVVKTSGRSSFPDSPKTTEPVLVEFDEAIVLITEVRHDRGHGRDGGDEHDIGRDGGIDGHDEPSQFGLTTEAADVFPAKL